MCLPLAQGERRGNRRKLLLHLLRAEAAAPSPRRSLPQATARRRPGATTLAFPTPAQLRNAQDGGLSRASAPRTGVPGPRSGRRAQLRAGQRPPPAARGGCARRRAPAPPPGCFCPSFSFRACQDCSTLSVLPRKRLSIHLEARDAPPLAGCVTAGAEEREERGSGACPSAAPARVRLQLPRRGARNPLQPLSSGLQS